MIAGLRSAARVFSVLAVAVTCLAPGLAANAQAGGNTGWRVVKIIGPVGGTQLSQVIATSPDDAWAAGGICGSGCPT